jgi:septal ring factor EnvC (AmiA/AmiB activator)
VFKWLLVIAFVASIAFCAWRDYDAQRNLHQMHADIARDETELRANRAIDAEVQAFVKQKGELQQRIDAIDQLKQRQKTVADAVAKLSGADATDIVSVAVLDGHNLVINRR